MTGTRRKLFDPKRCLDVAEIRLLELIHQGRRQITEVENPDSALVGVVLGIQVPLLLNYNTLAEQKLQLGF